MKDSKASPGKSRLSGAFTPTGKRWKQPGIHHRCQGAVAASLLLWTFAAPAAATGPASSASVGISVSIAPSFRLASSGPTLQPSTGRAAGASYCIATNGKPLSLPILLVQASGSQPAETANPLPWCDDGIGRQPDQRVAENPRDFRLLIIRPE